MPWTRENPIDCPKDMDDDNNNNNEEREQQAKESVSEIPCECLRSNKTIKAIVLFV
jgi:hypothetical protein